MTAYRAGSAPSQRLAAIEGAEVHGDVVVRILAETPRQLVLEVEMAAGARSTSHTHPCDSAGVLLSGRVRAEVDGVETVLEPGDGFHHPEAVAHHVEALTDARWIEVKAPPVRPW